MKKIMLSIVFLACSAPNYVDAKSLADLDNRSNIEREIQKIISSANFYENEGKMKEAAQQYRLAAEIHGIDFYRKAQFHMNEGALYTKANMSTDAYFAYKKALETFESNQAYFEAAQALWQQTKLPGLPNNYYISSYQDLSRALRSAASLYQTKADALSKALFSKK